MITDTCVRWRAGRASWRPAAELFEASAFEVASIPDDTTARAFVVPAHYSHSYPAARRRFGLYTRGTLVGCAVFSAPTRAAVLRPWTMGDAVELARLTRTHRHRGNHRYAWGLTPAARRDLARSTPALSYPKFNSRACRVAPTVNTTCTTRPS